MYLDTVIAFVLIFLQKPTFWDSEVQRWPGQRAWQMEVCSVTVNRRTGMGMERKINNCKDKEKLYLKVRL